MPDDDMHKNRCWLLLLGTAQDAGLPQAGCECINCAAVWAGSAPRQHAVSAALIDTAAQLVWLIDVTPDFREQWHALRTHLAHHGLPAAQLAGVLLTHLHVGHYFGLMHFGREAMDWSGLQVHCSAAACDWLCTNQPWRDYVQGGNLTPMQLAPGVPLMLSPALSVTPRLVPHRAEHSDTLSFLVQGPRHTVLYMPDVDGWEQLKAAGTDIRQVVDEAVDVALLDATFWSSEELPGRDMAVVPHPLASHTVQLLAQPRRARVVLVHLNHTNPLNREGPERAACAAAGLEIGEQGSVYAL